MSVWTKFRGEFNFMSNHNIENEIMEKLGKPITWDELWESGDSISLERWEIPCGSEGSMQYHTISFYSEMYKVWKTKLVVSGNLRDYHVNCSLVGNKDVTQWLLKLSDFKPCLDFDSYDYRKKGKLKYLDNFLIMEEDSGVHVTYWLTNKFVKRVVSEFEKDKHGKYVLDARGKMSLNWDKARLYKYVKNEWVRIPDSDEEE